MSIRVFIADDHAVVREGLRLILEAQRGISVVGVAVDGFQALKQVLELKPDIVIMDITMPGLNGIEATEQILKSWPSAKVIILSMHSSKDHISHAFKAGARGYVLKESASDEVVAAVHKVYRGRRYLCDNIIDDMIDDFIAGWQSGKASALSRLSRREREVLQLIVRGKPIKEIALGLHLSPKTVDTYRRRLMEKLGTTDIPGLIKFAIQQGIAPLE